MKRLLASIMESDLDDPQFDAKMKVLQEQWTHHLQEQWTHHLQEQWTHHLQEEESQLFPLVAKDCSKDELEDMGNRMQEMVEELEAEGQPRASIPGQTDSPARI